MAAAARAKPAKLQPVGIVAAVLGRRVVTRATVCASQMDYYPVLFLSHEVKKSLPLAKQLGENASAYCVAALADGEAHPFLQGHGLDQFNG
jgi:hypothetical protein